MRTNEVKKQDKEVPVRLKDGTLECLTWWSNPNDAPVYFNNEIATELRKDKARLDWLLKNCLIKEFDLGWVHDSRETIDEAMDV